MARGEGRPEGVASGMLAAGIAGLGGAGDGGGGKKAEHRPLEEVFVKDATGLKLKGFVQEDFGVVFDEVCGLLFGVLVLVAGFFVAVVVVTVIYCCLVFSGLWMAFVINSVHMSVANKTCTT